MPATPWAPFYRSLLSTSHHRQLPPVRSHFGDIISQVYIDWVQMPPIVRIDCLTEIWKVATDPSGEHVSSTEDGKLVVSPLKPYGGTPSEFLAELDEALGPQLDSEAELAREADSQPLLDQLERYVVFARLLAEASASLQAMRSPAQDLEAANRARAAFLGDDIDHEQRSSLLATLGMTSETASQARSRLQEMLATETEPGLRASMQAEFDTFDRALEDALTASDRLRRASSEPPRRHAPVRPR